MGIPLELITFLGSTIIGGILKIVGMWSHSKAEREQATLQALNSRAKITKEAREYRNKNFEWTRRFIAISSVLSIVVLPILAACISPFVDITFGYTEIQKGFWPFTDSVEITKWYESEGSILILPFHTHLMSAISGMYFGGSLVGHNRS